MTGLQDPTRPLVLASASQARAALLKAAGLEVRLRPAAIDEAEVKRGALAEGMSDVDTAVLLAALKAERVAAREQQAMVIGADQLLVCEGEWFDKPPTVEAARAHLHRLRGRAHRLVTAVVCHAQGRRVWHHVATPTLHMRAFSDDFLDRYLAIEGGNVTQTVGGYRMEGIGAHLFDRIDGEHAAILGLPMLSLLGFLRQNGVVAA